MPSNSSMNLLLIGPANQPGNEKSDTPDIEHDSSVSQQRLLTRALSGPQDSNCQKESLYIFDVAKRVRTRLTAGNNVGAAAGRPRTARSSSVIPRRVRARHGSSRQAP